MGFKSSQAPPSFTSQGAIKLGSTVPLLVGSGFQRWDKEKKSSGSAAGLILPQHGKFSQQWRLVFSCAGHTIAECVSKPSAAISNRNA